jgi:hypothetical protein
MKDYSEDHHCAGWLGGLEFLLWEDAPNDKESFGAKARATLQPELRALAEIAGGWWVYSDTARSRERGPHFIPMERWLQIVESHHSD